MWEGELRHLPTRRNDLKKGLVQGYAILWNQCTPSMKSKLEQHPDYPTIMVHPGEPFDIEGLAVGLIRNTMLM